jgi:hypothetical protein
MKISWGLIAGLALVLVWASWLFRYDVTMGAGAAGPDAMANAVLLDRWTGKHVPLNTQLWMQTDQGRIMWPGSIPPDALEWWKAQAAWMRDQAKAEKALEQTNGPDAGR